MINVFLLQRSWAKVIFSQACVKNSVHGGGVCLSACWDTPPRADTPQQTPPPPPRQTPPHSPLGIHPLDRHPPWQTPLPPAGDYCSGRYASYWNAFLWLVITDIFVNREAQCSRGSSEGTETLLLQRRLNILVHAYRKHQNKQVPKSNIFVLCPAWHHKC